MAKGIGSISLIVLLFASTLVIIINRTSYAEALEPALVNAVPVSTAASTGSDEVAPASASNRFVVWTDNTPGNDEIFFRRSPDSGATWQATKNLSNNPGNSGGPDIAVSGSNVYVVWLQANAEGLLKNIFFRGSIDNGATWGARVKITTSGTIDSFPQMSAVGSNVFIIWDQKDGEVYFRRSSDNGATWQGIDKLSNNPGDSRGPIIAGSGSFVYVLWTQDNAEGTASDVFFRRSTDGGATWKPVENLSNTGGSGGPKIAVSGSNVHVVWSDGPIDDPADILYRRSTDNGANWKSIVNLSNDAEGSGSPHVAVSGSKVYVVWTIHPTEDPSDVIFRRSTDNGATWKSEVNLSDSNLGCNPSLCGIRGLELAVSGSKVYVVWVQAATEHYEILLARSFDSGATWKAVKSLTGDKVGFAFGPLVAVKDFNVYVVWFDSSLGDHEVFLRRSTDNGAIWKSLRNLSDNAGNSGGPQVAV